MLTVRWARASHPNEYSVAPDGDNIDILLVLASLEKNRNNAQAKRLPKIKLTCTQETVLLFFLLQELQVVTLPPAAEESNLIFLS